MEMWGVIVIILLSVFLYFTMIFFRDLLQNTDKFWEQLILSEEKSVASVFSELVYFEWYKVGA